MRGLQLAGEFQRARIGEVARPRQSQVLRGFERISRIAIAQHRLLAIAQRLHHQAAPRSAAGCA
jgi:hypothetical protein